MTENDRPTMQRCAMAWHAVFDSIECAPAGWLAIVERHCPELLTGDGLAIEGARGCSPAQVQRYAMARGSGAVAVPRKPARDILGKVFAAALGTIDDGHEREVAESALKEALRLSRDYHKPTTVLPSDIPHPTLGSKPTLAALPGNPRSGLTSLSSDSLLGQVADSAERCVRHEDAEELLLALENVSTSLRKRLAIQGDESDYFRRWMEIFKAVDREIVIAYIRPIIGAPPSWYAGFYAELQRAVDGESLELSYIFFEPTRFAQAASLAKNFSGLSDNIRFVCPQDFGSSASVLRTSLVLFTIQRVALTFERDDNGSLAYAYEWRTESGYQQLEDRLSKISRAAYPASGGPSLP